MPLAIMGTAMRTFLLGVGFTLATLAVGAAAGIASAGLASAMVHGAVALMGG